ncbi:MAG: YncE family protein [Myxococcota bacterium]
MNTKISVYFLILFIFIAGCEEENNNSNNVNNVNNTNNINNVNNTNNNINNQQCEKIEPISDPTRLAVVLTDYTNGAVSEIDLTAEPYTISNDVVLIHSDAVPRYFGDKFYALNRYLGDSLTLIDDETWEVLDEILFVSGSNPQDIHMVDTCKGYVSLYAENYLQIIDVQGATSIGTVDLSAWGDEDGSCEPAYLTSDASYLYVAIQNLVDFAPTRNGRILKVDLATDEVAGEIVLNTGNPFYPLIKVPQTDMFVVLTAADFSTQGAAIETFQADDATATLVISSEELGGIPKQIVFTESECGYVLLSTASYETGIREFCLDGTAGSWLMEPGVQEPAAITLIDDELFIADNSSQTSQIIIYDLVTREFTQTVLNTSLPVSTTKPFVKLP